MGNGYLLSRSLPFQTQYLLVLAPQILMHRFLLLMLSGLTRTYDDAFVGSGENQALGLGKVVSNDSARRGLDKID